MEAKTQPSSASALASQRHLIFGMDEWRVSGAQSERGLTCRLLDVSAELYLDYYYYYFRFRFRFRFHFHFHFPFHVYFHLQCPARCWPGIYERIINIAR